MPQHTVTTAIRASLSTVISSIEPLISRRFLVCMAVMILCVLAVIYILSFLHVVPRAMLIMH
jgi:hypothetical protein